MSVYARYVRHGLSPSESRAGQGDFRRITLDIDENAPLDKLEDMARQAVPTGYEFIEVKIDKKKED